MLLRFATAGTAAEGAPPDGTAVPADQPTEINNKQGWEDGTDQSTVVGHGTTTPPTNEVGWK